MKAKILVVSHDNDLIASISKTLEKEGHKVTLCDVPSSAVAKCREEKFDLVFIDVYIRELAYDKIRSRPTNVLGLHNLSDKS